MPLCGGLRIGVLSSEPKTPPLVMLNVPPLQFVDGELVVADGGGEALDLALDAGERHVLDVAQHRHGQPAVGADGDAEVDVLVVDDVVAVEKALTRGNSLRPMHDGAGEEAHEAEPDAVRLLEGFLVLGRGAP